MISTHLGMALLLTGIQGLQPRHTKTHSLSAERHWSCPNERKAKRPVATWKELKPTMLTKVPLPATSRKPTTLFFYPCYEVTCANLPSLAIPSIWPFANCSCRLSYPRKHSKSTECYKALPTATTNVILVSTSIQVGWNQDY
jgi:hypothetical protein